MDAQERIVALEAENRRLREALVQAREVHHRAHLADGLSAREALYACMAIDAALAVKP